MPTYEYRCPEGHDFEHFVLRMSEAQSSMPCPSCGKAAERRISAGGGLLFKGSGFYITDYGKDGKKDQRSKPEPTAKTAEKSSVAESGSSAPAAPAKPSDTPSKSSGVPKSSDNK